MNYAQEIEMREETLDEAVHIVIEATKIKCPSDAEKLNFYTVTMSLKQYKHESSYTMGELVAAVIRELKNNGCYPKTRKDYEKYRN